MKGLRWTIQDLEAFPDNDGKRYEIIDGELYMSKAPEWEHQAVADEILIRLSQWSKQANFGVARSTPGLIFADDDNAIPDVVWISKERLANALGEDRKLHIAPELVVEILSPGSTNESRDREVKRKLYSRRGVSEYWIVSWTTRQIEVYRRDPAALVLELVQTLFETDILQSPLLPGFSCKVSEIFEGLV